MKGILFFLAVVFSFQAGYPQFAHRDTLKQQLFNEKSDKTKVDLLFEVADSYIEFFIGHGSKKNTDSAINYVQKAMLLASAIDYREGQARGLLILAGYNRVIGNYSQAINLLFKAREIFQRLQDHNGMARTHMYFLATYRDAGDYSNALLHANLARLLAEHPKSSRSAFNDSTIVPTALAETGLLYQFLNEPDSAEFYARKSLEKNLTYQGSSWNFPYYILGTIRAKQANYSEAFENYRKAYRLAIQNKIPKDTLDIYNSIAELYIRRSMPDSAIVYASAIFNRRDSILFPKILLTASASLATAYKMKGIPDSSLLYLELSKSLKDSIYSDEKQKEFQSLTFLEKMRQQETKQKEEKIRSRVTIYSLIAGAVVFLFIAITLYRSNLQKQKANVKIKQALEELRLAQAQLIQSEKMASLGELTAGIAHEIQNPLNFVNNFSEVNTELIEELKAERLKPKTERDDKLQDEILNDINENEQRINHHGKRADAIVKGMLQHSRTSSGVKEPTDINVLADEYLRLAYHGLRAKDKSSMQI